MRILAFLAIFFVLIFARPFNVYAQGNTLKDRLGKSIEVEGKALTAKLGAFVQTSDQQLWVEGLDEWPSELEGKLVKVSGTLSEKSDLPVFIPRKGEPIVSGIPVDEGTDLMNASRRLVLSKATWLIAHQNEPGKSMSGQSDAILETVRSKLPAGWKMMFEGRRLVFERLGEGTVAFENQINAPASGFLQKKIPERPRQRVCTKVIFLLEPKLQPQELIARKESNDETWKKINQLPEKFGIAHLMRKNRKNIREPFWVPPETWAETENTEQFLREKEALEKQIQKIPDGFSENYALTLETMQGITDDLHQVLPPEATIEAFQVLEIVRSVLQQ